MILFSAKFVSNVKKRNFKNVFFFAFEVFRAPYDKKRNANRIATGLENLAVHWGVKTQYESNIFDKLTLIAMTFENICNNIFISYF